MPLWPSSTSVEDELRQAWHTGMMQPSRVREAIHRTPETPRIVAIPNGVPVPVTAWQPRPQWQATPCAVFVGRLAPEKGLDIAIDAWSLVRVAYPKAQLILIGEGPERHCLEERVKSLGLSLGPGQAVELPGALSEPTEALRTADLFILPSREEGMSIALLEAMALGIPLVASSIPGNRRLVSDLEHGRLASADDPEDLARVIIDQWHHFDRAVQMGRAARSRVEQEFSTQVIARKHMALFRELVGQ